MESAMEKMTRCRAAMVARQPFFGTLAIRLELVERNDIETASTDGRRLYFNASFIAGLSDSQTMGLIAHETLHCANGHFARLEWRDLDQFNVAADYAINPPVLAAGFALPDGALIDPQYSGLGAEDIYRLRDQSRNQEPQPPETGDETGDDGNAAGDETGQAGQIGDETGDETESSDGDGDGDGDGAGTPSGQHGDATQPGNDPGKCGGFHAPTQTGDETAGQSIEELARQWETATRQAAAIAAKHAGEMPGYAKSVIDQLNRPRVDWRSILADFVNDKITADYSFSRPNRRFLNSGFSLPSLVPDGIGELVMFGDSSGSMDGTAWSALLGEIQGMLDSGFVSRVHMVQGDTKLCHVAEYETGDFISAKAYGGGGTDFRDCMAHIAENYGHAAAMVAFTDLLVDQDKIGDDPGLPVLWAVWGSSAYDKYRVKPEFGETMPLTE